MIPPAFEIALRRLFAPPTREETGGKTRTAARCGQSRARRISASLSEDFGSEAALPGIPSSTLFHAGLFKRSFPTRDSHRAPVGYSAGKRTRQIPPLVILVADNSKRPTNSHNLFHGSRQPYLHSQISSRKKYGLYALSTRSREFSYLRKAFPISLSFLASGLRVKHLSH